MAGMAAAWRRAGVHINHLLPSSSRAGSVAMVMAAAAATVTVATNFSHSSSPSASSSEASSKNPAWAYSSFAYAEAAKGPKTALESADQWYEFPLQKVTKLSPNTAIYHFGLPPDTCLLLPVASCIITKAPVGKVKEDGSRELVIRPYTPISDPTTVGHFDLIIKRYENGQMSGHISSLKPGEKLAVKGPIPKLPYKANSKAKIGMVAGGTGIAPMWQVVNAILSNPEDKTKLSLVFANITEDDILLRKELDALASKHKEQLSVYYVLDKPPAGWKGGAGYITPDMLKAKLPAPADDSLVVVCGPPGMMKHISGDKVSPRDQGEVTGLLQQLGYDKTNVYKF